MIRLCWLIALAVCFLSIGICFVIEPMHVRSPHRRSPIMMPASSRSTGEDSSNHDHPSAPMEMSRRGFLMSSFAALAILPSPLLAINSSPPDVLDTTSLDAAGLKRNNSTHTKTRPGGSRSATTSRYFDEKRHREDEDHKSRRKITRVKAKAPLDGQSSKGKIAPPRIKGLARKELFLKITEALV